MENSSLFQSEGIYVKENWSTDDGSRNVETHACVDDIIQGVSEDIISSSSDDWSEDDQYNNQHCGNLDTVIQPADFREFNRILTVAPAENNTPLGIFQDFFSEFLSFPTIYCGQVRENNNSRLVPYITVQFVNGNYEIKIEEFLRMS